MKFRSVLSNQSFRAVLLQFISVGLLSAITPVFDRPSQFDAGIVIPIALVIDSLALLLATYLLKMDKWWRYINAAFPWLLFVSLSFDVNPWVYFGALVGMLLFFWSTFKTRVPFFISSADVALLAAKELADIKHPKVIDLGSGSGDFCLRLSNISKRSIVYGVEYAPIPYLISKLRSFITNSGAKFVFSDYSTVNLKNFNIVFTYLSPAAMEAIGEKAKLELKKDAVLISHEFPIPSLAPFKTEYANGKPTFFYRF